MLARLVNTILTMCVLYEAFRGHREHIKAGECDGGDFLGLLAMRMKFDSVQQSLLNFPTRAAKYLSPTIQNELIPLP